MWSFHIFSGKERDTIDLYFTSKGAKRASSMVTVLNTTHIRTNTPIKTGHKENLGSVKSIHDLDCGACICSNSLHCTH